MYEEISYHIKGIAPLIMHNGQLANPFNPIVVEMKELTAKRGKTDKDLKDISDLEFEGGLYLNESGKPIIPTKVIEATMHAGAKKQKNGKDFKAGAFCKEDALLIYDGPKSLQGLLADKRFRDITMMRVGPSKVPRTRAIYNSWELKFTMLHLPQTINRKAIDDAVLKAGELIGFCDSRPKYGRFEVLTNGKV